jgi:hypothetical protein
MREIIRTVGDNATPIVGCNNNHWNTTMETSPDKVVMGAI